MKRILGICTIVVLAANLNAASISNGDFETGDPLGENGFRGGIETWTAVGSNQATLGSGFATSGHTGNIGTFWQGSGIRQDIGETVTANTPIQVQFAIGRRDDQALAPTGFTAGLYTTDDETALSEISLTDEPAVFDTIGVLNTVSFTFNPGSSPAKAGTGIFFRIISAGADGDTRQVALDNVTVSVVPEPTTYALISGLGLVGMAAYRRHKRSKA